MRADRLVTLVLLLRQRGQMSASRLAQELEVSTRTVLRDIEALSTAGVPIYGERGRHGGFALLPGFRTELTGLNHDEALALLTAGSVGRMQGFGLGSALASAVLKLVDALPEGQRVKATSEAQRILIEPDTDMLSRSLVGEDTPAAIMGTVRSAVLAGHKLRIHYAATDRGPRWRTIDPIGLVTARDKSYLLATTDGADRTYRLSRILDAQETSEPAERPEQVDLPQLWQERVARFRTGSHNVSVVLKVAPQERDELVSNTVQVTAEQRESDGLLRMELVFQDLRHADWAVWQHGTDVEVLEPETLRRTLNTRAVAIATLYSP